MREVETGTAQLVAGVDGGVGRIVFNNPERHNALTLAMQRALTRTLAEFGDDPDVRVVVTSGSGNRAFASGADVDEYAQSRSSSSARAAYDGVLDAFWQSWDAFGKPTIAMVRGYCIGGGLLVALKADIRVTAVGSQFAAAAAGLGAGLPTWGVGAMLAAVGPAYASELLFSARRVSAAEALAMGLVNRVVTDRALEATTLELAGAIAAAQGAAP